jgi:hypothetical protein
MSLVVQALQQVLAYIIEKETGLLAPRRPDGRVPDVHVYSNFSRHFARSCEACAVLNVTSIEKRGRRQQMPSRRREVEETQRRGSRRRGGRCNTQSIFKTFNTTLVTYI